MQPCHQHGVPHQGISAFLERKLRFPEARAVLDQLLSWIQAWQEEQCYRAVLVPEPGDPALLSLISQLVAGHLKVC